MNALLITNQCITDTTAGVAHSLRQMMIWLADAGHHCRCLCTARFETNVDFDTGEHVAAWDGGYRIDRQRQRPTFRFNMAGVDVSLIHTKHNREAQPHADETQQFMDNFAALLREKRPDVVLALNSHPMIFACLALAKSQGAVTAYAVRGYGYEDRRFFEHVDHAFTCSAFLTRHYRDAIGLHSTPLEPPIDWSTVEAPADERSFVTFINPMPTKGLVLFARLADMLGRQRPDIPVLVIQSGISAGHLNNIEGVDFTQYPQIMAAPGTSSPAEIYALTKLLLVPSVWPEPFGRVAAEAMINGIPALVSERGALPSVIGGDARQGGAGRVLPIPDWLTPKTPQLPSEDEVRPWFEAVCELWDEPTMYDQLAARGRSLAQQLYSEQVSRRKHVDYVESLTPARGRTVFSTTST